MISHDTILIITNIIECAYATAYTEWGPRAPQYKQQLTIEPKYITFLNALLQDIVDTYCIISSEIDCTDYYFITLTESFMEAEFEKKSPFKIRMDMHSNIHIPQSVYDYCKNAKFVNKYYPDDSTNDKVLRGILVNILYVFVLDITRDQITINLARPTQYTHDINSLLSSLARINTYGKAMDIFTQKFHL